MRALVITGAGSARVEEVGAPVAGPGQVVVDVRRAGICGTDVELFTGKLAYFAQGKIGYPIRPGHEWCGVVSALGEGVDPGWLGARVTGDTMLGCGRCPRCAAGRGHVCADRREVGIVDWHGALAEKVLVRTSSLYRLPDAVVDCTDDHRMPAAALARAEPAGRLVYIGIAGVPSPIDSRDLVLGDLTAVGILGASAGIGPAIEHYADGRVNPSRIAAVTAGLDEAAEALAGKISAGAGTKILIDP